MYIQDFKTDVFCFSHLYSAVSEFTVQTDGNLVAFEEFLFQILDSEEYALLFNRWLKDLDDTNVQSVDDLISTTNTIETSPTPIESTDINENFDPDETTKYLFENTQKQPIDELIIFMIIIGIALCVGISVIMTSFMCRQRKRWFLSPSISIVPPHSVLREVDLEMQGLNQCNMDEMSIPTPNSTRL